MAQKQKGTEWVYDYLKSNVSAAFADVFKFVKSDEKAKVGSSSS